jgi:hypothetical protein
LVFVLGRLNVAAQAGIVVAHFDLTLDLKVKRMNKL